MISISRLNAITPIIAAASLVTVIGTSTASGAIDRHGSTLSTRSVPFGNEWTISNDVHGCAPGTRLLVPKHYNAHPGVLKTPSGETIPKNRLNRMGASQAKWSTSLVCKKGHPGHPLKRIRSNSVQPKVDSTNWSGYVGSGHQFTDASFDYTEPFVAVPEGKSVGTSIWPGIGLGTSTSDPLIQAGTEQDGSGDSFSNKAWYEIFPQEAQQVISNFSVNGADSMFVDVGISSGGQAWFLLENDTTGQIISPTQAVPGQSNMSDRPTADWVVERTTFKVGDHCELRSLNDFNPLGFTSVATTYKISGGGAEDSVEGINAEPYSMYSGSQLLAAPGPAHTFNFGMSWYASGPTETVPCG